MIDSAFLLAASSDSGFLGGLLSNVFVWGQVALGIGLVIFVHELGHFVAAKTFGVKCEKFYVGFDVPIRIGPIKFPSALFKYQYGETEYGIGVVPLGGYVKMLGQDDDPRKMEEESQRVQVDGDVDQEPSLDPRSFPAKPVWQRMIIISAGVVVNVVTGVIFAAIAFGFGVSYVPAKVGGLVAGAPAWQAGIAPGGTVVGVGDYHEDQMRFMEMRVEIVSRAMANPDASIPVSIEYPDGVREFPMTATLDKRTGFRVIGLLGPKSAALAPLDRLLPHSVAKQVLVEQDKKAAVIGYDGNTINPDDQQQVDAMKHYLYTHPSAPIELTLRRSSGETRQVVLAAQRSLSLGFRFAAGPVTALIKGGPAEAAGMKVGDRIVAIDEQTDLDAYQILSLLAKTASLPHQSSRITVRRDGQEELIELEISPSQLLQTESPTLSINQSLAIHAFGFAYQPLPLVAGSGGADGSSVSKADLAPGDEIRSIRWVDDKDKLPEYLQEDRFKPTRKEFAKGWEFKADESVNEFRENLQVFPPGASFEIVAFRPSAGEYITVATELTESARFSFDRGLQFDEPQAIRTAGGVQDALSLGVREGKRRLHDVLRFLRMLPTGQVKMQHVGGPVRIATLAKQEAEEGVARQLMFLTMLSMNLAILNFLPIPALDGGHMVFLTYELFRGKRANEQLEMRLTIAGFLSLLALMVVVFANDILQMFG